LPRKDRTPLGVGPCGIAIVKRTGEHARIEHIGGAEECTRAGIHQTDTGMDQIVGIDRLTPDRGVEVKSA